MRIRTRLRQRSGFTLVEVMLALIVFLVMTLIFAAVFPTALRAAKFGNNYAQAIQLAQHKIDQLRATGAGSLTTTSLLQRDIIDNPQPTGYPISNPTGYPTGSTAYSFTSMDNLLSFFPPGSTGVVVVSPDANGAGNVYDVTAKITWSGAGVSSGSYKLAAVIAQ